MNVVGKVGNLITQGVYSVATPFHPFGGAVDVIVVKQQDGSFRTTPWYVRFGKFQGVLKGAEKVVRISVNGVDSDFHMYLDNSGEAYFVKEVDNAAPSAAEDSDILEFCSVNGDFPPNEGDHLGSVRRLEHSVSDSGIDRLQGERGGSEEDRPGSDCGGDRRLYEFPDEQAMDGDDDDDGGLEGENGAESQNLDSEVVLVSVDGHILTAPITSSEQSSESVQLSTPRFHLGPGEEAEFEEGGPEFSSGDNGWSVDYMSKLNGQARGIQGPSDSQGTLEVDKASSQVLELSREVQDTDLEEKNGTEDGCMSSSLVSDVSREVQYTDLEGKNGTEDGCKSFSQVLELSREVQDTDLEEKNGTEDGCMSSSLVSDVSREVQYTELEGKNGTEDAVSVLGNEDGFSPCSSVDVPHEDYEPVEQNADVFVGPDTPEGDNSLHAVPETSEKKEDEQLEFDNSTSAVETDGNVEDEGTRNGPKESPTTTYDEMSLTNPGFEISLCGNKLQSGMGLDAAAEAFNANRVSAEEFKRSASSILKNGNLIVRFRGQYLPWEKSAHIALGIAAFGLDLPIDTKDVIPVEQDSTPNSKSDDSGLATTPSGRRWRLWPIPFRRGKTLEHTDSSLSNDDEFLDSESVLPSSQVESSTSEVRNESPRKQLVRTNVPSSEQIASLNLKEGQNIVTFSFSTRVLGQQQVEAHMYLWKWNARIVISDVDGTITKSDVLGQFMPLVGKDWTQSGVAKLFSAIKENGYQLLFLSARAIVQAYLTRSFLLNLKQDGNTLPSGPVVISPDGLFPSLYREVIRRAPHEFKIACLEDIKRLFPSDYNPFYAGFGNRDTDELSYRKIGIPKGKIFIINPKGEVAISHRIDVKSYTSLHTLVNDMFPPTSLVEQEDFNSWNFWKVPYPEIEE